MSPLSDTPEETVRPELGVSDKEDTKNVRGRGGCRTGLKTIALEQGFPNMFLEPPIHCTFCMYQTHLIQHISSLEETVRPELGVSDKEDTKNVRGRGACWTGLKTTYSVGPVIV